MAEKLTFKQQIIVKALKDPAFKEVLIADPKDAILDFAKDVLSADQLQQFEKINFNVIEEQADNMTIVVPYVPEEQRAKIVTLDDEELVNIAAGRSTIVAAGTCDGCRPTAWRC